MSSKTSAIFSRLKVGPMKRLYKYYTPEAINFAGGVPMDSSFPIKKLNIHLDTEENIEIAVGNGLSLNYIRGDGIPELKEWVQNHVKSIHSPPSDFGTCVTVGSTDAYAKTLALLSGDTVLFDQYAYGTAVAACRTYGRTGVGVKMDSNGMVPDDLRLQTLRARENGLDPDIVYLVPTAQNPTGVSMSSARKEAIYRVCQDLDLYIIEDDAYYYLYHGQQPIDSEIEVSSLPGFRSLPRSLLSMDTDGRVIRMDSLSKFICPGMRLGWVSAPAAFTEKYLLLQEMTTQFPSGLSQSAFTAMLKGWGDEKLNSHLQHIQGHYCRQRNAMCSALLSQLDRKNVSFEMPDGGMFVFLYFREGYINMSSEELFKVLARHGVIIVPGDDFKVEGIRGNLSAELAKDSGSQLSVRLSYAAAQPAEIADGVSRLAKGLKEVASL